MERERVNPQPDQLGSIDALSRKRLKQLRAVMLATGITLSGLAAKGPNQPVQPEPIRLNKPAAENIASKPIDTELPTTTTVETSKPSDQPKPIEWLPDRVKQEWPLIERYSVENGIDPNFLAIVISEETLGENVQNTTGSGAAGPAQVMQPTADGLVRQYNLDHSIDTKTTNGSIEAGALAMRYIKERHLDKLPIEPYSDEWIYLMVIGYGDGEPALTNYFQTGHLSQQAQKVAPQWIGMWHERDASTSSTLKQFRGVGE